MSNRKIKKSLGKSPINYFSDLFVVAMVVLWVLVVLIMCVAALISTICYKDNMIWSDLGTLVAVPLATGGGIWMIKNSVQHAIINSRGKIAPKDFPEIEGTDVDDYN